LLGLRNAKAGECFDGLAGLNRASKALPGDFSGTGEAGWRRTSEVIALKARLGDIGHLQSQLSEDRGLLARSSIF
jgi:hypothetical protein